MPVRKQGLFFRPDWEKVVTPAVDYALTRPDVDRDKLALLGMSLGGYLAAHAVAFEKRFKAAVFYDGVLSLAETTQASTPKEALEAFNAGDNDRCNEVLTQAMKTTTGLRWMFEQGRWSMNLASFADLLEEAPRYSLPDDVIGNISCPCLVSEAEGDIFFKGQRNKYLTS